jgi:hypothetical protein
MQGGKGKSRDFSFPKPLPTHRRRRVQSVASFYAAFRPLFSPRRELACPYTF